MLRPGPGNQDVKRPAHWAVVVRAVCVLLIAVGLGLPLDGGTRLARAERPIDVRITDIRDT